MKKLGKMMGYLFPTVKLFEPKFTDATRYNLEEITRNEPANYTGKVVPGSARTILNGMAEVEKEYGKFDKPYLIFQGGCDKLVDPFAPLDLEIESPSKDKTTYYCRDMWHAVFAEP